MKRNQFMSAAALAIVACVSCAFGQGATQSAESGQAMSKAGSAADAELAKSIAELNAMRVFIDMLRQRIGSPLSLASLARDLQIAPTTLGKYLEILEALHIVFVVRPFHRNIARSLLKEPKVYFFDTGLVDGDDGARFENACATMLMRHTHFLQDHEGRDIRLHYVRDKEGREIDFALCEGDTPLGFAECKLTDPNVPPYLAAIAERFPTAGATLLVRHLRQTEQRGRVAVEHAADWLARLAA